MKSRTLSAQLPFSFPLSPLKRQHVTDSASINILPIHLPGGGESGTRQRAAHAARLSAKGRQLAGAFSTLCAFTRKRRDVESFHFCRFLKKSLFDERLELGGSFMFRNTSSSHASLDAGCCCFNKPAYPPDYPPACPRAVVGGIACSDTRSWETPLVPSLV